MSMKRQNCSSKAYVRWAGPRETSLDSGRGGAFFVTSLFIELIEDNARLRVRSSKVA
jgi:hypothetical protein